MDLKFKNKLWDYYNAPEALSQTPKNRPFIPTNYIRLKRFFKELKSFQINKILDIGCQQGFILEKISAKEKYGVDVAKHALAQANEKGIKAKYVDLNEKKSLPYKKDTFDFVISLATLEHIFYPEFMVEEVFRVLKPGGFFYLMTDSADTYMDKLGFGKIKQKGDFNEHLHHFTKSMLLNLLKDFKVKRLFSHGFITHLPYLDRLCAKSIFIRKSFFYFNELLSKLPITKKLGSIYFCLAQKQEKKIKPNLEEKDAFI